MRRLLLLLFLAVGGCSAPGTPALDEPFRVLLLGDSISIGYTPYVQELLEGRAFVVRPTRPDGNAENCEGTNKGVANIDRWLGTDGGGFQVIHFNFGLHDLKHVNAETGKNSNDPADPHQADPQRYEAQLRTIVARLRATGARLVFATTTPYPDGVRPFRAPRDAERYNEIALRVMKEANVAIDDLYAFARPRLSELQQPENVHFTKDGSRALAEQVAESILAVAGVEGLAR